MPSMLADVYQKLLDRFGPQHWWPGNSPLEVMVGAVLTQNTNWNNVAKAIENLKQAGVLEIQALCELSVAELAELIRPAGYYRVKAKRLLNLLRFVDERYGGSLDRMFAADPAALREELLAIHGIGPETADAILLYAGGFPTFVVDAYTKRVLVRHGWIEPEADYHQLKEYFESTLARDASLYNEYHALLVAVGKQHCKTQPLCDGCPLEGLLPESGPQ